MRGRNSCLRASGLRGGDLGLYRGRRAVRDVDVGGWLRTPRLLGVAAACAAPVLYARWVRPRLITWGATRDEATGAYPGDELIPG